MRCGGGLTDRHYITPVPILSSYLCSSTLVAIATPPSDICKQHLREKYRDKLRLVEEFIVEIEGAPRNCDVTRWGQFTDIKDIKKEMFTRLEVHFENWLNP